MIETNGSLSSIIKRQDAEGWVKKIPFQEIKPFELKNAPDVNQTGVNGETSFSDMLVKSLEEVNKLQGDANVAIQKLATGKSQSIHETMLAVEKAEIAFKTMNQIRLKVIEAYKEVMKMQV
jgi:flagellar hook-basal body complex protein FliE